MSRLTKIEGEFMGVGFEVKATPVGIDEITDEVDNMMISWYEENEPDVVDNVKNGIKKEDLEDLDDEELSDKLQKMKAWMKDKDFRAKYLKTKADYAMDWKGDASNIDWSSPTIELSTIQEAWDFFCGNRIVPQNGVRQA